MSVSMTMSYKLNSQNVANNTSNVTVYINVKWTGGSYNTLQKSGYCTIDGTKYEFTSSFNTSQSSSGQQTIFAKTVNVTHNSDGTKELQCSGWYASGTGSGNIAASFAEDLPTIARASSMSVGNGTLGTAQTLTVTRQSTSFTHTITATCGSASTTICTKSTSTSISFTPPLSWASQNTTGTSVTVVYTLTTYNSSTKIGDSVSYTKTCSIPASVKPSCTISISDATSYYGTFGSYVKGYSKLAVTITATQAYSSPISSYSATANSTAYKAASFTTGILNAAGTSTVTATVTDKRGRTSNTATASVTVLDYSPPKVSNLSVARTNYDGTANEQGSYVYVYFGYSISSLNNKNSATYTLQYKKSTASSWSTVSDIPSSGVGRFAADTGSSYDVQLTVTDKITKTTQKTSVSTAYTIMHWKANGLGMGIGKISEEDNVLDVGMRIHARNGIIVDGSWANLTLSSRFAVYNGTAANQPMYKVSGNVITVKGVVTPVAAYASSTSKITIATGIPAAYRPSVAQTFVCQGSGMNRWTLTVEDDGSISEARYGVAEATTIPINAWMPFTVTYQV